MDGSESIQKNIVCKCYPWPIHGNPCPPGGTHRYFFRAYSVDTLLSLEIGRTKAQFVAVMKGHLLSEGQLMEEYKR